MVSNFLAKALRFPATAPTLLALSLTAFVASQLHDRLSSQAFPDPSDDQDSDNSPDENSLSLQPATPLDSQVLPEQLPLEISPLDGLPNLDLSPDGLVERLQPSDLANVLPNLGVALPQPIPPTPETASVNPQSPKVRSVSPTRVSPTRFSPTRVSPRVVESVVSQSLGYKTVEVAANPPGDSFSTWVDLQAHWSKPYVEALADLGLIKGLPNGHFDPDRPMTRAELADLLQRSLPRSEDRPGIPILRDVPSQHWAAESIERAVRMGFFPDAESTGSFNPDRPASRLVTWGAIVSGLDLPSSKQHNELLQAWEDSRLNSSGTNHSGNLETELSQPVTRGEVAALLYHALRFTDEGKQLAYIAPDSPSTLDRSLDSRSLNSRSLDSGTTSSTATTVTPATASMVVAESTLKSESPQKSETSLTFQSAPQSVPPVAVPVNDRLVNDLPGNDRSINDGTAFSQPLQPPLLVAAQLPLPDPLLSPLPPLSEDVTGSVGSDDFGLSPDTSAASASTAERVAPEFSAASSKAPASLAETSLAQNSVETAFSNPTPLDQTYTLGAGDRVFIEVFGLPEYSQEYQVLVDGSLNLPRAGRMVVEGMTLTQAESLIYARYARYYQQPATSVVLVAPRSLRISVTGEVNRPGVYRLSPSEGSAVPSLTQALQEAGGIRQDADLRQVKVYRSQRNGDPQELALNLWSLLQTGDLTQDISLRDGDRVVIPKAEAFKIEDVNQIATANIAPSTINITVVGSDAENQGSLQVSPNTPLNQVVLAAGGFNDRRESRTVNLIRLHPNGTVEQRLLEVPIAANVNEENNPILRDKDVIVLDRSKGEVVREGALGVLGNILRVIPFVNFFF